MNVLPLLITFQILWNNCNAFSFNYPKWDISSSDIDMYWKILNSLPTYKNSKPSRIKTLASKNDRTLISNRFGQMGLSDIKCPGIPKLPNGIVHYRENNWIGARVLVSCAPGFIRVGSDYIECQQNGRWSDPGACNEPVCEWPRPGNQDFLVYLDSFHGLNTVHSNSIKLTQPEGVLVSY